MRRPLLLLLSDVRASNKRERGEEGDRPPRFLYDSLFLSCSLGDSSFPPAGWPRVCGGNEMAADTKEET